MMIIPPTHVHDPLLYKKLDAETTREICACGATRTVIRSGTRVEWREWILPGLVASLALLSFAN